MAHTPMIVGLLVFVVLVSLVGLHNDKKLKEKP